MGSEGPRFFFRGFPGAFGKDSGGSGLITARLTYLGPVISRISGGPATGRRRDVLTNSDGKITPNHGLSKGKLPPKMPLVSSGLGNYSKLPRISPGSRKLIYCMVFP